MNRSAPRRAVAALCWSLLAALLLTPSASRTAWATPGAPPAMPGAGQAPPILAVNDSRNPLHLTADQQQKWAARRAQFQADGRKVMEDKSLTMDQKNKKVQALYAATEKDMRSMLTPAQQVQADKQQGIAKKVMAMRQQAGQQYQALKQQLSATITPDQKAKLLAIDAATRKQGLAIQTSTSLSMAQKQAKVIQLRQAYTGKMNAALNKPVQQRLIQQLIQLQTQEQAAEIQAQHQQ